MTQQSCLVSGININAAEVLSLVDGSVVMVVANSVTSGSNAPPFPHVH